MNQFILRLKKPWDAFGTQSFSERMVVSSITFTFLFYLCGALYLVAPILGWGLLAVLVVKWASGEKFSKKSTKWLILLWCVSAIILELSLIVAHIDFNLGFGKVIKSTIGWAKGWALLSIFVIIGYAFDIRYQAVCRAACVIGLAALISTPILILAYLLNLPETLYVSPLKILGGSGPEFFTVRLYEIDPFNGRPRWRFFAPWAPAVGFVANLYFLCAWFDKDPLWRSIGLIGNALMIILAASRMGLLVMLFVPTFVWVLSRLTRPWLLVLCAACLVITSLFIEPIFETFSSTINDIKSSRADSTRVREALGNIALYRWQSEAFWFGHGVVESGTHLVEFMPIGSHHNWYGLLFVKGVVGFLAFLAPFALSVAVLLVKAQYQVSSRLALGMTLILAFFSLSENIEALAYMTWPAWLLIGMGIKDQQQDTDTNPSNLLAQYRLNGSRGNLSNTAPALTFSR